MIELTLARTKELLAEAVAEKGADFVYVNKYGHQADDSGDVTCYYAHGDQPGCIVGNVLHRAGVLLDDLAAFEAQNVDDLASRLFTAEAGVKPLLIHIQAHQDVGVPWGEAVRLALAVQSA
jgi:hypothetical protein